MEQELPKRKSTRLEKYDYSIKGAYFVTLCTKDRMRILSAVIKPSECEFLSSVGVGAHDDPREGNPQLSARAPRVQLTHIGQIIEKNLLSSENISGVKIDRYVIMPDHIHAIIILDPAKYSKKEDGSSRAPTPTNKMLPHVISTFKRFCNKEIGYNIFQRNYADHIIRDQKDYDTRINYMYENPIRWYYDKK